MEKLPVSICILSWNNRISLANSLKSYKKNGLLNYSDDITILFQEASTEDIALANNFNIKHIALAENIGIGKGFMKLAEQTKYENILFLENDWELIENSKTTFNRLQSGLEFLYRGYDVVRYRSRKSPGHPLYSLVHKGNELEYFDDWHQCTSPHLLESLHWLDPSVQFPDKIQKEGEYFITTSRWANWTNNPFLIKKEFYLKTILQFAGDSISFEKNIAYWWARQTFKIAQGEGLFTHKDLKKYPQKKLISKIKKFALNFFKKISK